MWMVTMRFDYLHRSIEYIKRWKHTGRPDSIVVPFSRIWFNYLIGLILVFDIFLGISFCSVHLTTFFVLSTLEYFHQNENTQWFTFVIGLKISFLICLFVGFFTSLYKTYWTNRIWFKIPGRNSNGFLLIRCVRTSIRWCEGFVYNLIFICTDRNNTDWVKNVSFVVRCFI